VEISAYYKVSDQVKYPAVLLTTGINDPRVTPWEPGKMAARLQAATGSWKADSTSVDYQGGHGALALPVRNIANCWLTSGVSYCGNS